MSNKAYINYLNIKRDFETQYSQAVARLAVAPAEFKDFWRAKLEEVDNRYSEFKKVPVPDHEPY